MKPSWDYKDGVGSSDLDMLDRLWCAKTSVVGAHSSTRPYVVHMYHPRRDSDDYREQERHNQMIYAKRKQDRDIYYKLRAELGIEV